jgi:hypothetical protein
MRQELSKQTSRDEKISTIFDSTLTKLQELPSTLLSELPEQRLDEQVIDLQSTFVEYQSTLEDLQKDYTNNISSELRSFEANLIAVDYASNLKRQLKTLTTKAAGAAVKSYQTAWTNSRADFEAKARNEFQSTFEKHIQRQVPTKLQEHLDTRVPELASYIQESETLLNEALEKHDITSKANVDKYWLPITKIVDEYTTTVAGNLHALNTAIASVVDQATINITTSLANFADESSNLSTATAQAFDREKTGFNEQITQGINEMKEDCLGQLQEAHSILLGLGEEISRKESALNQKMETLNTEIENAAQSNFLAIRETADSFVENIQNELETQSSRVENIQKNINDLILQQATTINDSLTQIQSQMENFDTNQLSKATTIIDEIGQTYVTKNDELRTSINSNIETFAETLAEETDQHVTTLQQEITQLQTVVSELITKLGSTEETISTGMNNFLEASKTELITVLDEQQVSLDKNLTNAFQSIVEQMSTIQTQLVSDLKEETEKGKTEIGQSDEQLETALKETQNQILTKSTEVNQTTITEFTSLTTTLSNSLSELRSTITSNVGNSSDQLEQSVTTKLTGFKEDVEKICSDANESIEEDNEKLKTGFGQEVNQHLQSFAKARDLTQTRLIRANQDNIRHIKEVMQQFNDVALTDIQQGSETILATIQQIVDMSEESLVTQTQQTGRRINQTLSKERQTLKTEYQTLAKEITSKAKAAETTSVNTLQIFSKKTEPILERLRSYATDTEKLLTGLWDTLSTLQPAESERTWRIVTCEGIQNHLLDMFQRVDETVTLVYPSFDEVPVVELSKVQPQSRVHIITTLDGEKHRASAQKLLQQGNIRIWNNPKMEFYGGSRDGEEVLIAPTYGNEGELVAVVSDQASYISLFNRTLGPRWISASLELRQKS